MQRRAVLGWVTGVTVIGLCGAIPFTPPYLYWHMLQRYPSAVEAREALKRNPNDARAYRTLAMAPGEYTRAKGESPALTARRNLRLWEQVARCDPGDQMAEWYVALMSAQSGDRERAKRLFREIAQQGHPSLRTDARKALIDLGDTQH